MSLDIVLGPMFSGKSTYALSYVRRHHAIGKNVLVIKPNIDNRYSDMNVIVTHDGEKAPCIIWDIMKPLCEIADVVNYDCVVIEEAQFFRHLHHFCEHLVFDLGKNVLIVGLDGDARQQKFGEILDCIPMAETVKKLSSFCSLCKNGNPAHFTKKISKIENQVDVGGPEKYIAVCLKHL